MSNFIFFLFLLVGLSSSAYCEQSDTLGQLQQVDGKNETASVQESLETDDDSLVLMFMGFVILGVMVMSGLVSFILALIGVGIIFLMVALGILSVSTLVGLNKMSLRIGFKFFIITGCAFFSIIGGASGTWLLNRVYHWWPQTNAIVVGSILGCVSGILVGYLLYFTLLKLLSFLKQKFSHQE